MSGCMAYEYLGTTRTHHQPVAPPQLRVLGRSDAPPPRPLAPEAPVAHDLGRGDREEVEVAEQGGVVRDAKLLPQVPTALGRLEQGLWGSGGGLGGSSECCM